MLGRRRVADLEPSKRSVPLIWSLGFTDRCVLQAIASVPHAPSRVEVFVNDRFTKRVKKVLFLARDEAERLGHDSIDTEHFLLGLMREGEGGGAQALENLGVTWKQIERRIETMTPARKDRLAIGEMPFSPRAKRVLELSVEESRRLGHNYIGTEHLLLGLVREGEGVAARAVFDCGVDRQRVTDEILRLLESAPSNRRTAGPAAITEAMIRVLQQKGIITEDELAQELMDAVNRSPREQMALFRGLRLHGRLRAEIVMRLLQRKGIITQEEIDAELGRAGE